MSLDRCIERDDCLGILCHVFVEFCCDCKVYFWHVVHPKSIIGTTQPLTIRYCPGGLGALMGSWVILGTTGPEQHPILCHWSSV